MKIFQREQTSLFGGILDWMLIPLLLLWPISLALTWLVAMGLANKPYDRGLEQTMHVLEAILEDPDKETSQRLSAASELMNKADGANKIYFEVRSFTGPLMAGEALPEPEDEEDFLNLEIRFRDEHHKGQQIRVAHQWFKLPLDKGTLSHDKQSFDRLVLLQVAESFEKRSLLAQEIVKGVMLPQFAILPLAILVLWIALARGLQPLRRLEEHIRKRKPDDLSPLDDRIMPFEVMPLVTSINELLARLKSSIETKKRFLADAAHQLKTPLAGLRMQAELAQTENLSNTELRHTLKLIGLSSVRATRMVNQLLSLARAEVGAQSIAKVLCDLGPLVEEVLQETWPLAAQKYIDLGYHNEDDSTKSAKVEGNPILLKEMIRNLLENAINYTPSDAHQPGVINLGIHRDFKNGLLSFVIEDSGPGISESEKELVFQPFYRSLGLGGEVDGSGLGLSIVKEIADQHQAHIYLEDAQTELPATLKGPSSTFKSDAPKLKGLRVRVVFEMA